MKELQRIAGGYPRDMNYMLDLQDELFKATNGLFSSISKDMVLQGCEVTDHLNGTVSIASGLVYINGVTMRFEGAGNIPLNGTKVFTEGAPVSTDTVTFQDDVSRNLYKEVKAVIGNLTSPRQIVVKPVLYSFKVYVEELVASYGQKGETKWVIDLDGDFLANFDSSGLGVTPRWQSWALMNDNNGAPTMAGRSPKGVGAFVDAYGLLQTYTNNQTGGQPSHKLTLSELPAHKHTITRTTHDTGTNDRNYVGGSKSGSNAKTDSDPIGSAGGSQPHNIDSPYRAGYWVIKIA